MGPVQLPGAACWPAGCGRSSAPAADTWVGAPAGVCASCGMRMMLTRLGSAGPRAPAGCSPPNGTAGRPDGTRVLTPAPSGSCAVALGAGSGVSWAAETGACSAPPAASARPVRWSPLACDVRRGGTLPAAAPSCWLLPSEPACKASSARSCAGTAKPASCRLLPRRGSRQCFTRAPGAARSAGWRVPELAGCCRLLLEGSAEPLGCWALSAIVAG